jgi:4,5-dihydroxyphthalate decarboxylase
VSAGAAAEPLELRALLDDYPHLAALKDGTLASPRLNLTFADVKPVVRGFGMMAERQAFDVAEMAIVTFLQALSFGKPILLLPAVVLNRFHHGSIVCRTGGPIDAPGDLNGKRIGVRAYTQTTGVWVRGIYHAEYGLDLGSVTNVTTEGGHLSEFIEPPNVVRAPAGTNLGDLLLAGEIDAWIAGREAPRTPEFRPVLRDADAAALDWFERVRAFPVNHMIVVAREAVDRHPWLPAEVFDLLKRAKTRYLNELRTNGAATAEDAFRLQLLERGLDPLPYGVEALRRSLEVIVDYAVAQALIPRRYAVDELFDDRTRDLA